MAVGLVVGNRGFFPGHLAESGRREMLAALERAGFEVVTLAPEESRYGAVESYAEAQRCAE
ncbi:MAG: fucose isomerase, partial [Terriglobales bacterium]